MEGKKLLIVAVIVAILVFYTVNAYKNGKIIRKGNGKTLYVGGSGPNNYSSIQKAINFAEPGDTIFIYDDSSPYYESH